MQAILFFVKLFLSKADKYLDSEFMLLFFSSVLEKVKQRRVLWKGGLLAASLSYWPEASSCSMPGQQFSFSFTHGTAEFCL